MLKSYFHKKIAAMEREFGYDATYTHEMLDASLPAFRSAAAYLRSATRPAGRKARDGAGTGATADS